MTVGKGKGKAREGGGWKAGVLVLAGLLPGVGKGSDNVGEAGTAEMGRQDWHSLDLLRAEGESEGDVLCQALAALR